MRLTPLWSDGWRVHACASARGAGSGDGLVAHSLRPERLTPLETPSGDTMIDYRPESRSEGAEGRRAGIGDAGGILLLMLTTLLGLLWAIVLVTHFHAPLSSVGQSLWLTR